MSVLGEFLLAPASASRSRRAGRTQAVPASFGVVAPGPVLRGLACAVGVALARRGRAARALVCLYTGVDPAPERAVPRAPRDALAGSLAARGVATQRRGRLLVSELPGDPDDAARTASLALAAGAGVPCVLGVSLRAGALDDLLAGLDGVLVVPPGEGTLAELACASTAALGPATARVDAPSGPLARGLATAGLAAPAGVRRAIAGLGP